MFSVNKTMLCAAAGLLLAGSAFAMDPVTEAIQGAYAPYRVALFKTNAQALPESVAAVNDALAAWTSVRNRFAVQVPAPYDGDAEFAATLKHVESIYLKAKAQVASSQSAAAHETLEEIRDALAELRKRNNVIVFSDAMNAYHAQMELVLKNGPALLAGASGTPELTAQVGALHYLAVQLQHQAPPSLAKDPRFLAGQQSVEASVAQLQKALWAQDTAAAKDALSKLKVPYSKFFLIYG